MDDTWFLALIKGDHRYLIFYDRATAKEALESAWRWASDPELNFTWYDAAVFRHRICHQVDQRF